MPAPDQREFTTFRRGYVRDQIILAHFRNELRLLTNPESGDPFTEDEITRATQPGSRWYIEADAIDLVVMSQQQRAMWLADQIDPRRASTRMLDELHGELWLGSSSRLPAAAASGDVLATGLSGTAFVGSTTADDPNAAVAVDANGTEYQLLQSASIGAGRTSARLTLQARSGGFGTNIPVGTVLTWTRNKPSTADATAQVIEQIGYEGVGFSGGYDGETDAEYARRIADTYAERPGAGNAAQFQAWAQAANSAVEQAFVYPCALNAGSVLVVPTQRRDQSALLGAGGRMPSAGLLADLTAQLVPPGSSVVPEGVYVLVASPRGEAVDMVLRVAMSQGSGSGWYDAVPWPNPNTAATPADTEQVEITTLTSQTVFRVTTEYGLPGGASSLADTEAPALMVWSEGASRFERLDVSLVTDLGGDVFEVQLNAAPGHTLAVGDRISPYTDRAEEIAVALEQHFDLLGPGEIVAKADSRWSRAARRPLPAVRYPQKVGAGIAVVVAEALGSAASDVTLPVISRTEPSLAGDLSDGPAMLVLGAVSVYPED